MSSTPECLWYPLSIPHKALYHPSTYSSVSGVIFFSSTSSSAKFFWYFSQLEPVAEGMFAVQAAGWVDSTVVGKRESCGSLVSVWRQGVREMMC
jgi:hypothetical protein